MTTIITGTTQGLGQQLQTLLVAELGEVMTINRRSTNNPNELLCDVSSKQAVEETKELLLQKTTDQEVLFVLNAAIYGDDETVSDIEPESLGTLIYANVFGQLTLVEALLQADKTVRLAAVSSGMGSASLAPEPYHYAYSASKAALDLSIRLMSKQYQNLSYLIIDPGWMRTRMGGAGATEDPKDVAQNFLRAIHDPHKWNNPTGMLEINTGKIVGW
jgi:NAD(P)-dependent dehydrogenase (short-subunit alcohol dehydrogenase family)